MGIWAIDLDGVVWRGAALVPGSDLAVRRLLDAGHQVVFCTNHAQSPAKKRLELLALGVLDCPVVTSAEAAAAACPPGARVLTLGDPTLLEVLSGAGLVAIDVFEEPDGHPVEDVDVVVVGASSRWDRSRVGMAADAVRAGARFLATNDDPTFPVTGPAGRRLLPGNGALVAAVATASGRAPEVTGKPHAATASLLVERYGPVDVVVGDKPETDGGLAVTLGARFGLVLSGVTAAADLPVEPTPWRVADDLAALVDATLADSTLGDAS
ncbi:MAG: HAD hydrolase-like protein [Actinomycetota bacterium]|nr:HAD hydrolase-like protein [Actinomycetota bacterium]